jgi:S1-C subfamily serine protease
VGRGKVDDAGKTKAVLITAAHVLNDMIGPSVVLVMRRKLPDGSWQEAPIAVPIQSGGRPLWVRHPRADVAAINLPPVPEEVKPVILNMDFLATDQMLEKFEVHPGDELNVLGFPLGYSHTGGFPVLRSGKIASFPLVPTSQNTYFLLDFRVFKGNSGGPVYLVQMGRAFGGNYNFQSVQFLAGLVSEEVSATEQFQGLYENRVESYPLGLAKIVPAPYISETIKLLPQ